MLASVGVQKTALFAANAGARRKCENSGIAALVNPIPYSAGLKPAVIVGGIAASAARTVGGCRFWLPFIRCMCVILCVSAHMFVYVRLPVYLRF